MPRFFITAQDIHTDDQIVLTGENAAHAKVLRLKSGESVTVCDGHGTDYVCIVSDYEGSTIRLTVLKSEPSETEPGVFCSVYLSFPKADKLEHVIQKATELGASEIVCFPSSRSVSRPDEKSLAKKLDRWKKIAASAAEQSGRGLIPQVITLSSYTEAVQRAAACDLAVCFYENEENLTLHRVIEHRPFQTVAFLTGPEGGLSEREVEEAAAAGLHICTLGKRILRCETAPLCALSAVMYAAGEF